MIRWVAGVAGRLGAFKGAGPARNASGILHGRNATMRRRRVPDVRASVAAPHHSRSQAWDVCVLHARWPPPHGATARGHASSQPKTTPTRRGPSIARAAHSSAASHKKPTLASSHACYHACQSCSANPLDRFFLENRLKSQPARKKEQDHRRKWVIPAIPAVSSITHRKIRCYVASTPPSTY